VGYTVQTLQKPESQKPRPIIDEEFGHLSTDPTLGTEQASAIGVACPVNADASTDDDAAKQSAAEPKKADPGFLDSFMHFVQGKKPETLASVSSSVITKKPVLPKYIPEPPRPKPPPPPPVTVTTASALKELTLTAARSSMAAVAAASAAAATASVKPKTNKITVHFSDDEDDESLANRRSKLSSMVNRAITSLDSISNNVQPLNKNTGKRPPGRPAKSPGNLGAMPKTTVSTPKPKEPPKQVDTKAKKVPKHGKGKMAGVEPATDKDYSVVMMEPVVARQKTTRKAKEKTVQKQRSLPQTIRKR